MKKKILNALKILAFFSVGIFLFWLVYRKQDMQSIIKALLDAKYWWLILSILIGGVSHIFRSIRWNLLLQPMGYKAKTANLFFSVMVMYLANLAIPRSGEFVRCGIVNRYEKVPFTKLLGSVISERAVDVLILFILIGVVLITQLNVITGFMANNPYVQESFVAKFATWPFILAISAVTTFCLLLFYIFRKKIRQIKIYQKLEELIKNFWTGLISVFKLKKKGLFILYSLIIWICYYLMIVVSLKAFNITSEISLLQALTVFVMTTLGMVVPAPGGMGAWHFLAIETLFIYGIARDPYGNAFAFAAHESQMLMIVIFGFLSLIALPVFNTIKKAEIKAEP